MTNTLLSKIALGTVQFGLDYGISNTAGQVTQREAQDILNIAQQAGINTLDTAAAYGIAEVVLGQVSGHTFQIITKFAPAPYNTPTATTAQTHLNSSLKRLNRDAIYGYLVHDPSVLLSPNGDAVFEGLRRVKADGFVEKIGVSAYSPDEINTLSARYDLDLVQVPVNPLDARWDNTLQNLNAKGTEIHIRSLFLQGVLLMPSEKLPHVLSQHHPILREWHTWCHDHNISPLMACLGSLLHRPEVAKAVIGVTNQEELSEIIKLSDISSCPAFPQDRRSDDPTLLDPSKWMK